jgi:hypothetical protein
VVAGTATAVSNRVSRRQAGRWAAQDQEIYGRQQALPAAGTGADNTIEQLRQLADLRAQGVLNDAEFEEQKARVLGS